MHYDILTSDLIQRAAQLARSLGHSYVGSAHLLLVMAREPGAVGQTLRLLGMDPDLTEAMARLLYGQGTPELPLPQGLTGESRELLRGRRGRQSIWAAGKLRRSICCWRWQDGKTATHMSF